MLTVTPEREKLVAFSEPTRTNVNEVVVTGPGAPPITSVDDLAGQAVFVRKGSLYQEDLVRLSAELKARGKAPIMRTSNGVPWFSAWLWRNREFTGCF